MSKRPLSDIERELAQVKRELFLAKIEHDTFNKATANFGEDQGRKIGIFYFPSYSPELYPDEYLNGNLRSKVDNSGKPVLSHEDPEKKTRLFMLTLVMRPAHVRS